MSQLEEEMMRAIIHNSRKISKELIKLNKLKALELKAKYPDATNEIEEIVED